jgi:predicted site-specific integrase-resolvase
MSEKPEKLPTPRQAATINVDLATMRPYVRVGLLPARRPPSGYIRLPGEDVETLLRDEGDED